MGFTAMTDFIIKPLEKHIFAGFVKATELELKTHNATWILADANPGFPCRVSLVEANVGERVLVLPYAHHDVASPYRASGPIYVREHAEAAQLGVNEIPEILRERVLSVRAYNNQHYMVHAEIVQGAALQASIRKLLDNSHLAYLHIHNANPGCFNCSVYRA